MRILITRPEPEASRFAALLKEHGIDAVVAPVLVIEPTETPLPPLDARERGIQALLFTSANGVRAYAARKGRTDLPVYAVGDATAAAARDTGFANVVSAGSDWQGLAALVAEKLDPAKGPLLHPTGVDQAGDITAALQGRGFDVVRTVVYRAAPVAELALAARAALAEPGLDGVALFSPRSAEIFVDRAAAAGLAQRLAELDAFCISRAVAEAIEGKAAWRAVRVAARPNAEALIASIRAARDARKEAGTMTDEPRPEANWNEAERIIAAFGGIRPMAKALGIAVTTVQGWKERGAIPLKRAAEIREAAARAGIDLDAALAEAPPRDAAAAETARQYEAAAEARRAPRVEAVAAEKMAPAPEPGLRAAEASPPPPPAFDASPAGAAAGRWRWAMFGAGFGAAFVAGGILAVALGIGGRSGAGEAERAALDQMQSRINRLTSQLEEQQKRQQGDAAQLQTRLNRIETAERALGEQRERLAGFAATAAALATRIERLDMDLKGLAARSPAGADEIKGLKEQIEALAKRVDALPKDAPDAAALAGAAGQLKQMGDRLAAMERRIGELAQARPGDAGEWKEALARQAAEAKAAFERLAAEARAAGQKLGAEAEQLRKDLAALQAQTAALAQEMQRAGSAGNESGTLIVAAGQLRRAVNEGAPYRAALDALAALAKDRAEFAPPLEALKARAEQGIPTSTQLRARFDRLAVAVQRAAAAPGAEADFWDRVWSRVQSLVTVRRTGEVPGETVAARLSRAEAALARGDLAEAVKQLEGLAGAARAAAAGWIADAKARLAADAALAELDRGALALLRTAPKAKP